MRCVVGFRRISKQLKVSQEQVAIDTCKAYALAVADGENILEGLDSPDGLLNPSPLADESSLVVAISVSVSQNVIGRESILDLVK